MPSTVVKSSTRYSVRLGLTLALTLTLTLVGYDRGVSAASAARRAVEEGGRCAGGTQMRRQEG